jgi:hypothetical protein|tara:strand:- start:386 stop:598 length:213 start_codon:yes stop_codon:yes gene_type:complete
MASVRACGHKILILPFLHLQIIDAHMAYVVTAALAQQHNVKVPQTNRAVVLVFEFAFFVGGLEIYEISVF